MLFIISFLTFVVFIQGDWMSDNSFLELRRDLQKIIQLEDIISKIKYIHEEKISFDLMPTITQFDLFCQIEFPQQIITYSNAWECWHTIANLWNKKTPYLQYNEFNMILKLLTNWKHLKQEYINLKVVLLDVIYTYVEYEKQLEVLYNKYESKEKIIELMIIK